MAIVTANSGIDVFDGLSSTTSGDDTLNAANGTANAGDVWNGGDGTDTLVLTSSQVKIDISVAEISGIESLVSGRRGDIITMSLDDYDQFNSINTGKGKDTLNIAMSGSLNVASSTLATLTGVEILKLIGSSGADSATFTGAQLDKFASIAMGGGLDLIGITSTSLKLNASSDFNLTGVETVSAAGALSGVVISLANQTEAMTIIGGNGADTITGTTNHDTINAGGGNDTIRIATGQFIAGEALNGGAGTDTLLLDATGVSVDFSAGTLSNVEKLTGSSRLDTVTLTFAQWSALNSIDLGTSSDTLTTKLSGTVSFSDHPTVASVEIANLVGTAGDEAISLDGATLDALISTGGKLDLGNGADVLSLLSTSAVLNVLGASDAAISGVETITAQDALSGIVLSLINQTEAFDFTGSASADDFTGGLGADLIAGGLGDDVLKGGGGNDQITGGGGADQIDGGAGIDTVNYSNSTLGVTVSLKTGTGAGGDAQGDVLTAVENITGSNAADRLTGDANANIIAGGSGLDRIEGGAGADQLAGGLGRDTLSYAGSAAGVTVNLAAKTASGGDAAGDVISGFENLTGSRFADTLTGSGGANLLAGGNGNDTLNGGGGADILNGGKGADKLLGGFGNDKFYGGAAKDSYTGGAGADTFYFTKITEAGKGLAADTITDFTTKVDKINLSAIDADTLTDGNQSFTYIGGQVFHHTAGELRYDKAAGVISGDVNGDGAADFQINLLPGKIIAGGDFIL